MSARKGASGPDVLRVRGARENNLKDVSLDVPANAITVFVGVSGSGKSSLVFDTIAVEAQRQLNATFPWSVRNQLPKYERPDVDELAGLTSPVIVDQNPIGGTARSTVGTISDVYAMVRALFATHGDGGLGHPAFYSFNDPRGMCPECDGLGRTVRPDPELLLDFSKSLEEGAIQLPGFPPGGPAVQFYTSYDKLPATKKIKDFTAEQLEVLLHGSRTDDMVEMTLKSGKVSRMRYEGLVSMFTRRILKKDDGAKSDKARAAADKFIAEGPCPACHGERLQPASLATTVGGTNIAEWSRSQITDLIALLDGLDTKAVRPIADSIATALRRIDDIGLGYLSLDRPTASLSGGEGQRLKLVKHLASDLVGMTYVFDEPSVGLHPRDVDRLNDLLRGLRDKGNTVLVVEHDPDVIEIADHVVEIGPGAGVDGGGVVFEGTVAALLHGSTRTSKGMRGGREVKTEVREATGVIALRDVSLHNLKDVSVDFPTGVLTAVTGVAGSGKSSLMAEFRARHIGAVVVDQSAIAASSRSTPATFLGLMDPVRKLFAKVSGEDAGLFSFNSKGACEDCGGRGEIVTELAYMDPVRTRCETCGGRRFTEAVLDHTLRGASIADVLAMTAVEAQEFFTEQPVLDKVSAMIETGVGYLGLGQSLSTLSGGERQRIKLADQLRGKGSVYVLDEPTSGLHMADIDTLLALMNGIVDRGNTVIVVEHNLAVIEQADWVIDLGPDGGRNGGEIVFTGTPADLLSAKDSLTGQALARYQSERAAA